MSNLLEDLCLSIPIAWKGGEEMSLNKMETMCFELPKTG